MSGVGGDVGTNSTPNPFLLPIPPTSAGPQTFASFPPGLFPTSTFASAPTITFSDIVTKTKPDKKLPAGITVTPTATDTIVITNPGGQNTRNGNTISTAATIFSIMVIFIIVGGCIALIFTRKRRPAVLKRKKTNIVERNSSASSGKLSQINSISPPLNLPPPPPRHSLPPVPQSPALPPLPPPEIVLHRYSSSPIRNYNYFDNNNRTQDYTRHSR